VEAVGVFEEVEVEEAVGVGRSEGVLEGEEERETVAEFVLEGAGETELVRVEEEE